MRGSLRLVLGLLALLLASFLLFQALGWMDEHRVATALRELARRHGEGLAGAAIVGLLVADLALPVPGSVVMTAAGYFFGLAGAAWSFAGVMGAACLGYELGRVGRQAQWRWLRAQEVSGLSRFFQAYGGWAILLSRGVPMAAEAVSCLAGLGAMPRRRFAALTAAGSLPLCLLYAWAGASARASASSLALAAALVVPALAFAALHLVVRVTRSRAR